MNILIIGANGRVGNLLTKKLLYENHNVIGSSRQQKVLFNSPNYKQINIDITKELSEVEKEIPDNIEAIYFVSGSRGKNLLQVDLHGAVKIMKAAQKKNINRFIMLSTIFALKPERWETRLSESMNNYYIAKYYADSWLINNTNLNYTILQPATLKEGRGSGKIEVNVETSGENSIENVADTLVEILNNSASYKKIITMHDGKKDVKEAISGL